MAVELGAVASTSASVVASAPTIICVDWPAGEKRRCSSRASAMRSGICAMAPSMEAPSFSGASFSRLCSRRQFEIDGQPVGPQARLLDQPWARLGDRLEVDVAAKAVVRRSFLATSSICSMVWSGVRMMPEERNRPSM